MTRAEDGFEVQDDVALGMPAGDGVGAQVDVHGRVGIAIHQPVVVVTAVERVGAGAAI